MTTPDPSGREEYERLAKRIKAMGVSIPWETKQADAIHQMMVEMGRLVDKYRQDPCFS